MAQKKTGKRMFLLDEIRGFAIILMVLYHAFYLVGYQFDVPLGRTLFDFFTPAEPYFAAVFVLICGICCHLSHNNLRRGLWLAGAALLLSACLYCAVWWGMLTADCVIWFGILHCLATCILLYALLRPALSFIPAWIGVPVCLALFLLCWHIPANEGGYFGWEGLFAVPVSPAPAETPWLYPLGLCPIGPCGDYFPLLPWGFCFLAGTFLGRPAAKGRFPKVFYRQHVPFLGTAGRYSLYIYLLHQPVLYLVCELIVWLGSRF